ncbi:ergothioneine biosynthesis glutamate--cysteine ligase EgtA [Streptomyces sp. 4N509B]|uniref:ergothioneine biosynthesis glutamate--cysteine ligase EgtA n=1 Tax=Streptomyces sp. 4N509B TaxID=3457413 RepID=UPI003FD226E9
MAGDAAARPAVLSVGEALAHVGGSCFAAGSPPARTGVELEWLVRDREDAARPVPAERLDAALAAFRVQDADGDGRLPFGSRISREPGGQLELSTLPAPSLAGCVEAAAADLAVVRAALDRAGLALTGDGLDPARDPTRVVDSPRYRAMESYFTACGFQPWGRMMMCATAAVHVNLDCGDDGPGPTGYRHRWLLAHRLGPVLVAAFANSPLWRGRPTGWRSTRQALWARIDPARTAPPRHRPDDVGVRVGDGVGGVGAGRRRDPLDPRDAWAAYALDAPLLCLPPRHHAPAATVLADGHGWDAPRGLTFRAWLDGAPVGRPPTVDDLRYHLGTLFPPVRPRGWLELRMIDAQRGDDWVVATAVAATLLDDPAASAAAWRATGPLCPDGDTPSARVWARAARSGPADPALGPAVRSCFAAAREALAAGGAPASVTHAVAAFAERYADRGRCPADDHLDATVAAGAADTAATARAAGGAATAPGDLPW